MQVRGDSNETHVEQTMEIGSEKETIAHVVGALVGKGPDVGCLQGHQSSFARDSTATLIGVCHQYSE
jgi:hypothetical protein